jgi:hypothetical protein
MIWPTVAEIRDYRDLYQTSMQAASKACFGVNLIAAIHAAETTDDLKEILLFMAGNKDLY